MPELTVDDLGNANGLYVMFRGNVQGESRLSNPVIILTYEQGTLALAVCTRREQVGVGDYRYVSGSSSLDGSVRISDVTESTAFSDEIIEAVKSALARLMPSIVYTDYSVTQMTNDNYYTRYLDLN